MAAGAETYLLVWVTHIRLGFIICFFKSENTNENFRVISGYLARLGIRVNCRFVCETTVDALEGFCSAPLNLLAYGDYTGQLLRDFFTREYGSVFYDRAFPVGFDDTAAWLNFSVAPKMLRQLSLKTKNDTRQKYQPSGPSWPEKS